MSSETTPKEVVKKPQSVFAVLPPYRTIIVWLILLATVANALSLLLPKLIATVIDSTFVNGGEVTLAGSMEHALGMLLHEERGS